MIINFNPAISTVKNYGLYSVHTRPSFGNGQLDNDIFQPTHRRMPLSRSEVLNFLNKDRSYANLMNLSEETINEIKDVALGDHNMRPKFYATTGRRAARHAIRKYLLNNMANKNTFELSMYEKPMEAAVDEELREKFNPKELTPNLEIEYGENPFQNQADKNLYNTLAALYLTGSTDLVYKFLEPTLKKLYQSPKISQCEAILKNYFSSVNRAQHEFRYDTEKLSNGKYKVSGYLDDIKYWESYARNENNAKRKLFENILLQLKLHPSQNMSKRSTYNIRIGDESAKREVQDALKDVGFLKDTDELDSRKDALKITHILNALAPSLHSRGYNFQILEYYGDSVVNLMTSRFLKEKNISKESNKRFLGCMISNQTMLEYTLKTGLDKHLHKALPEDTPLKVFADMFEAFVGALHFSYPEEQVYEYLKPLFEQKYQQLLDTYSASNINEEDKENSSDSQPDVDSTNL